MVSAGNCLTVDSFHDGKTECIARIIRERLGIVFHRVLVVGCGSGIEAAILGQELDATVIGIDLSPSFSPIAAGRVELRKGDATCLDFEDRSFDLVYCFHALEHIPNYRKALEEMKRVLSDGGRYCIGTPNRERLLGYIGSKGVAVSQKINWNLIDLKARLKGKFRNEYGAHAGFTSSELQRELETLFNTTEEITLAYYLETYKRYNKLVNLFGKLGLGQFLFPSVYFIGKK